MLPQDHIDAHTPAGPTLTADGAAFKVWAPRATAVYLNGVFGGVALEAQSDERLMQKDAQGYWTGFQPGGRDGDLYRYFVVGEGSAGFKRDPYARELEADGYPNAFAVLRDAASYPWRDAGFRTPDFSDMVIYQAHVGTFATRIQGRSSTFLDVALQAPYLARLGVNVLQLLPIDEQELNPSMGYGGVDLFSPDFPYVASPADVAALTPAIDAMFAAKGFAALPPGVLNSAPNQLKVLVDACHAHGIAVMFDVVYNHAGGFDGDDHCLFFFDRKKNVGNNNDSLYFTDQDRGTGGLAFAMWQEPVMRFLLDNARWCAEELHADGLRYDEISTLLATNQADGWRFCRDVTSGLRAKWPRLLHNAEFWAGRFDNIPGGQQPIVAPASEGGAGFDVVQHDYLRSEIRGLIGAAAGGGSGALPMDRVAAALYPPGFDHGWRAVTCIENHDLVFIDRQPRIAALADPSDHRSWYARSRARVAAGLLLTAPGIPQLFMGQEFLEDKPWNAAPDGHLIWWQGFDGADRAMADYQRCIADLIALRRAFPALRSDSVHAYQIGNDDRVLAFQRWTEGGGDVVVVASLAEATRRDYRLALPGAGVWREVFNSDAYDHWPNPWVAGNGGAVVADRPGLNGMPASAAVVLPANALLVFAR